MREYSPKKNFKIKQKINEQEFLQNHWGFFTAFLPASFHILLESVQIPQASFYIPALVYILPKTVHIPPTLISNSTSNNYSLIAKCFIVGLWNCGQVALYFPSTIVFGALKGA
jgi:hypothetical protein